MTGRVTVASATAGNANERTPLVINDDPTVYSYDPEDVDDGREVDVWKPGKSSFNATLLNVLGDLIGTGLLACPLAIAHSGWVIGPLMLFVIGGITLWTLKILLRIIAQDRRMRNFTDVIGYALGVRGEQIVTGLFVVEVGAWIIALVILFSDSMEAVWPILTSDQWKVLGLVVIIPTVFMPLRYLSFSSALGMASTVMLIGILIFTGLVTPHTPGSLREPAHTDLWPSHGWVKLGTVFGLLIAGFGGHGLIPNLIYDMEDPHQAERVCEVAYIIAMSVYVLVAVVGYLMYGTNVTDEVSRDLALTPGAYPVLIKLAVWMVAINPLTKIALGIRPLADLVFTHFGLHKTELIPQGAPTPRFITRPSSPTSDNSFTSGAEVDPGASAYIQDPATSYFDPTHGGISTITLGAERAHDRKERRKAYIRNSMRVSLALLSVLGAFLMPSFEAVIALLGSAFAVITLIIIPVWAGASVFGWHWYDVVAIIGAAIIGIIGTVCAFAPDK